MSQLQKLLNHKFPIYDAMPFHELKKTKLKREAFAEGYNARVAEEQEPETMSRDTWDEARRIRDERGLLHAVKYLKDSGRKETLAELRDKVLSL